MFEGGEQELEKNRMFSHQWTPVQELHEIFQGSPVLVAPQSPPVTMAPQSPVDFGDSPDTTEGATPPKSPRSASSKLKQIYQTWTTKRSPSAKR